MNLCENLILVKGIDKTADIQFCEYIQDSKKYEVTFLFGKTYLYNCQTIEWIQKAEMLDPTLVQISYQKRQLNGICDIRIFHSSIGEHWHICFFDGSEKTYLKNTLMVIYSCLGDEKARECLEYLQKISSINELVNKDGERLLEKQYAKLAFVEHDTALAVYLSPQKNVVKKHQFKNLIFPFGGNASQFKAVNAALNEQISVIQGPPGTGKTQTILNIIANLLIENKTIQVVSNNNSATENILEKLASPKYNLGFLVAFLGNAENKKQFIENEPKKYPDFVSWSQSQAQQTSIYQKIKELITEIEATFEKQERLAKIKLEKEALFLEKQYFEQYCGESRLISSPVKTKRTLKSEQLLQLWLECSEFVDKEKNISFWFKVKSRYFYGIGNWNFYQKEMVEIITYLQRMFYEGKQAEINNEIAELEAHLNMVDAKGKMAELTILSMSFLRAKLADVYGNNTKRDKFSEVDIWKNGDTIVKEYPIILSTTFSAHSCLPDVKYDYLIMDEASQVDIATGALALASAKNAVIVGDLKQLPNVITQETKEKSTAIFNSCTLNKGYNYSDNSFLKSICKVVPNVKETTLREHYRCHPKIIGFCNQKFYNNELIIMTEDNTNEADEKLETLLAIKTNLGKHSRGHVNQRQIDVIVKEALPRLAGREDVTNDIGIIAPYKKQVAEIAKQLNNNEIEVDTVHKFQGKEKDTILLTTVDDVVTSFSDDPYLLNVAVSRAKNRLWVIISGNEQPTDSNLGDLIDYIAYNQFKVIDSGVYSIFDLLYKEYTKKRIAYLQKYCTVSKYDSENLMYATIVDILTKQEKLPLEVMCHYPLHMLIHDSSQLTDEEYQYAKRKVTHLDFLIYNRVSKKTVLVIEVDGFHYHQVESRQYQRDRMKDHILEVIGIPLLRFSTTGSSERETISKAIDYYASGKTGS
ncbi:MAG: AAA domain-containing protein [Acidaminococcaceae bacterium]